jgi:hypothetical protein
MEGRAVSADLGLALMGVAVCVWLFGRELR